MHLQQGRAPFTTPPSAPPGRLLVTAPSTVAGMRRHRTFDFDPASNIE